MLLHSGDGHIVVKGFQRLGMKLSASHCFYYCPGMEAKHLHQLYWGNERKGECSVSEHRGPHQPSLSGCLHPWAPSTWSCTCLGLTSPPHMYSFTGDWAFTALVKTSLQILSREARKPSSVTGRPGTLELVSDLKYHQTPAPHLLAPSPTPRRK